MDKETFQISVDRLGNDNIIFREGSLNLRSLRANVRQTDITNRWVEIRFLRLCLRGGSIKKFKFYFIVEISYYVMWKTVDLGDMENSIQFFIEVFT